VVGSASCIAMWKNHQTGSALSCTSWTSDESRISIEAWRMEGETWRNANLELGKFRSRQPRALFLIRQNIPGTHPLSVAIEMEAGLHPKLRLAKPEE
jgi:hypothetical protein